MPYLIIRDGKTSHALKLDGASVVSLASAAARADLLSAVLLDAGVSCSEIDAPWLVPAARAVAASVGSQRQTGPGVCDVCRQERIKDGVTSAGNQRWRCPVPHNAKTANPSPRTRRRAKGARRGTTKAAFAKNPRCPGCDKPMNVTGRAKGVTYYKCKQGCPDRARGQGWSSVNLPSDANGKAAGNADASSVESFVRRRVAALNHHNSQNRDDIVQEILLAVESEEITRQDLHDDNVLRRYIRGVEAGEPNKFRDVSLDARGAGQNGDDAAPLVERLVG